MARLSRLKKLGIFNVFMSSIVNLKKKKMKKFTIYVNISFVFNYLELN